MRKVAIIGAGVGGLAAAALLAAEGCEVTVLERAVAVGGKMREVDCAGAGVDSGPTVLTMRWVFEALFARAGAAFEHCLDLDPLQVLARHAWQHGPTLDLHADPGASADAIGAFAGAREAAGFRAFLAEAQRMYRTLRAPFLEASKPNPLSLAWRVGPHRLGDLMALRPFDTMWQALGRHFHDPRLKQLFARYATYCGASPFRAPATLMLIAAVEQDGVWTVRGGMQRLGEALAQLAERGGARLRLNAEVTAIEAKAGAVTGVRLASGERVAADAVICNADPQALNVGLFGAAARGAVGGYGTQARSLSALTWSMSARAAGFPLVRHNVFFSSDYAREFADLGAGRLPAEPTIYVCAQDRHDAHTPRAQDRLLVLVNAPPRGDAAPLSDQEIDACETKIRTRLARCGLHLTPTAAPVTTTPAAFAQMFPATGGALYGRASHGWAATFQRPGARTALRGLYLAGGGTHPGPGVPMAALSGMQAANAALAQFALTRRFRRAAMPGGTSTRSATTSSTA